MKEIYALVLLILLSLVTTACATATLSPSFSFKNSSPSGEIIKNIDVNWNGYYIGNPYSISVCRLIGGG